MITIKLEEHDAAMLAVFCQKISMEALGRFASDNDETHRMSDTFETIQNQLWELGYNPADVQPMGDYDK